MLAKFTEAAAHFTLVTHLETGKRGRYKLIFVAIDAWNAETKEIVYEDDEIPETPWLAFSLVTITGKGDHRYDEESGVSLLVTHHALSRLAQRCGARTIWDVMNAARDIGSAFFSYGWQVTKDEPFIDNTRMRVETSHGTLICPLRKYNDGGEGIVVATLWKKGEQEEEAA